jgi:type II secretory ATPase GspE/PulE/Tfp pilus assembly ATPase PilB-like protein
VLEVNDEIAHMVVSGATPQAVREVARTSGMRTMGEEGMFLVGSGVTTIAEVIRNVHVH